MGLMASVCPLPQEPAFPWEQGWRAPRKPLPRLQPCGRAHCYLPAAGGGGRSKPENRRPPRRRCALVSGEKPPWSPRSPGCCPLVPCPAAPARPHPSSLRLAAPGPCSRRAGYRETSLGSWASPRPLRARARPRSPAAACSRPPPGPCGRRAPLAQARGAPPRPRPTFPGHLQTPRRARRGGPGAAAGAGAGLPSAARRAGGAAPGLAVRLNWVKATLNTVALCAN